MSTPENPLSGRDIAAEVGRVSWTAAAVAHGTAARARRRRGGGAGAGSRDHALRVRARAQQRRHLDDRLGRAPARAVAPHRQLRHRAAQFGHAADRRPLRAPVRDARGPHPARADARRHRRALERRVALQRLRGRLLDAAPDAAADGSGHSERWARDRIADRRLLPLARAWAHLRLHPRRRGGWNRDRLHRQRPRGGDLLAGRVRAARDPRLLSRARAVADAARAATGRPEPTRARRHRPARRPRRRGGRRRRRFPGRGARAPGGPRARRRARPGARAQRGPAGR